MPCHRARGTERQSPGRTLWEHRMPTPVANGGLRPEPHRPPSPLVALWVGGGALALGVVACLLSVICVHQHLEALRGELSQLREELQFHVQRDEGLLRNPQVRRVLLCTSRGAGGGGHSKRQEGPQVGTKKVEGAAGFQQGEDSVSFENRPTPCPENPRVNKQAQPLSMCRVLGDLEGGLWKDVPL